MLRGEAMTPARKAELEELANDLASGPVSTYEALKALLTVEREVFDRISDLWDNGDPNNHEFVKWCRTQAKETT